MTGNEAWSQSLGIKRGQRKDVIEIASRVNVKL